MDTHTGPVANPDPPARPAADRADELRDRWRRGERPPAEHFLPPTPDSATVLELVVAEVAARDELGERPATAEYLRRFPEHAAAIARQFAVYRALTGPGGPDDTPADAPAGLPFLAPPAGPGEVGRFAHYRVLGVLGRGGMGVVLHAEDTRLARPVALKVMLPAAAARPAAADRFLREARAQAKLQHDHVVPVNGSGESGGVPYLEMPLLPGETLADRLRREPRLPAAAGLALGRQAAAGLAAAHAAGLVHRDVKPSNLWLEGAKAGRGEPPARVRVLDFGLAQAADGADRLTTVGAVAGTAAYMSPEQAEGLPVDARSDLFGLGVVLYEALTGGRPFAGETVSAVLYQVVHRDPPAPAATNPDVPPAVSDVVMRLLAKNPAARPPSAAAVVAELAALERGDPPPPPAAPAPARRPRRTVWAALAAAGVAVAAVVAVVATRPRPPAPEPPADPPPAAAPVAYRGSVDLHVYRKDADGKDIRVSLADPRAVPLRPGDEFKVVAEVDPPAFLYVFWIDETGAAVPAYPWRFGEWSTRPSDEAPTGGREILWPDRRLLKITGDDPGTETVLMIARPAKLAATDAEVRGWFAGLPAVPFGGPRAQAWFEDFDLARQNVIRAPGAADPDPAGPRGLQAILRDRVGPAAAFSRAVSFSRLGKQGGG